MRIYSASEEQRARAQATVREWARSGLIDASQRGKLEADLHVDLRQTNDFLRAGLGVFTALVIAATILFVVAAFGIKSEGAFLAVDVTAAIAAVTAAEAAIRRLRFYRFGVEEALASAFPVLAAVAAMLAVHIVTGQTSGQTAITAALAAGALGALVVYLRFGFVYAAVGAMIAAAAIPFQIDISQTARHLAAATILGVALGVAGALRRRHRDQYPGDEYGILQAVALGALYLTVNLQVGWLSWFDAPARGWFYWSTYVLTWLLPAAGLYAGIREKDRPLMNVSVALACGSLITNKPYLGWPRHSWDPILLGALLIGVSLFLRRWLEAGAAGARNGFTSRPLVDKDRRALVPLRAAVTTFQPDALRDNAPANSNFDGGQSGGGGGGASF